MHATNRHRHKKGKRRIGSDTGAQKGTICGATTQSARKSITSTKVVPGNSNMGKVVEEVRAGWHTVALDVFIQ